MPDKIVLFPGARRAARHFAHVVWIEHGWPPAYAAAASSGGPIAVMTFRVAPEDYEAVAALPGAFRPPWGINWKPPVLGMRVAPRAPSTRLLGELLAGSYRLLAPPGQGL